MVDERQPLDKYIVLSEKANCTRLQVEVGRTLEISIFGLMNRSLAEIHALCDRYDVPIFSTILCII
jgi:hypothetical protein